MTVAIVVVTIVALFGFAALMRASTRAARPQPGDIWFVNYPFRDDWTKSKDRPALVVSVFGRSALVRQITSQDQSRRPNDYDLLPLGHTGLPKVSWVRKQPDNVPLRQFRRKTGSLR